MKPYIPTDDERIIWQIREAIKRMEEIDKIDEEHGLPPLSSFPPGEQLRTAIAGLVAALELNLQDRNGWDEVVEALALVVQAEFLVRQLEKRVEVVVS